MSGFCVPMSELSDSDSESDYEGSDHSYTPDSDEDAYVRPRVELNIPSDDNHDDTSDGDITSWGSGTTRVRESDATSNTSLDDYSTLYSDSDSDIDLTGAIALVSDNEESDVEEKEEDAPRILVKSAEGVMFWVDEKRFSQVVQDCPELQTHLKNWYPTEPALIPMTTRLLFIIAILINAASQDDIPDWFATLTPSMVILDLFRRLALEGAVDLVKKAIIYWTLHAPWTAFCVACELGYWQRHLAFVAIRAFVCDPNRRDPNSSIWLELSQIQAPPDNNGMDLKTGEGMHAALYRLHRALTFCTPPMSLAFAFGILDDEEKEADLIQYWADAARTFESLWTRPLSRREVEKARSARFMSDNDDCE